MPYEIHMPDEETIPSIYDTEPNEADLWFLPGSVEDTDPSIPPWPMADQVQLPSVQDWQRAEAGQGRALAEAASEAARLDERVRGLAGAVERLALMEVAALSWAEGARLSSERIALYGVQRLTATDEDARDLALVHWARRRLLGGPSPFQPQVFLSRTRVDKDGLEDLGQRPVGEEFCALADRWMAKMEAADLHPITSGAFAYHLWRTLGLSGFDAVIEPAVIAARISGAGGVLPFLPLAGTGPQVLFASGAPVVRLAKWYQSTTNACRAARLELDRLSGWQDKARTATSDLSGKVSPALIKALVSTPVLSAELAQSLTGASRAAAQRNLDTFEQRSLITEITGQKRYRFWKVRG